MNINIPERYLWTFLAWFSGNFTTFFTYGIISTADATAWNTFLLVNIMLGGGMFFVYSSVRAWNAWENHRDSE